MLEANPERPLTLISAPAGYGKSVLMSSWLEENCLPSAWISLDHRDNNFRSFVAYFLASLRGLYPKLGEEVQAMLQTPRFPPPHVIARNLINDLEQLDGRFILALDDYHFIHEKHIHDLVVNSSGIPFIQCIWPLRAG
jgi:LuxR family maltose regulon positive regulatory protein